MDHKLMDFLITSGGGVIPEIVSRVSSRPHNLAASLRDLEEQNMIKIEGPKSVIDFSKMIQDLQKVNGYDSYSKEQQRVSVLKKIFEHSDVGDAYSNTLVQLTARGHRKAHP